MSDQLIEKMNSSKVMEYTWEEFEEVREKIGTMIIDSIGNIMEFIFLVDGIKHTGLTSI